MDDFAKNQVQESLRIAVLCIPKVPLQGFSSVPAESVLALYYNVDVYSQGDRVQFGEGIPCAIY